MERRNPEIEGMEGVNAVNALSALDSTQLEFNQAMIDFQTMFPAMDPDVIEAVLRSNNGTVDATIDQLLAMSTDVENEILRTQLEAEDSGACAGAQGCGLAAGASSSFSAPMNRLDVFKSFNQFGDKPDSQFTPSATPMRDLKNWNPPMLGPLPKEFLRLEITDAGPSSSGGSGEGSSASGGQVNDHELAQFLEDERIAIFLQNEEFMHELRRNKDFMNSLEGGAAGGAAATETQKHDEHMHDDAAFREKLKNMGKVSKRKFAQMARLFQRTSAMAGGKGAKFKHMNPIPSRDNLLLSDEMNSDSEDQDMAKPKNAL